MRLPGLVLGGDRDNLDIAEDMGMAPHHLVGDRGGDVVEGKVTGFLGHACMEHDLELEIAEFVSERIHVLARDRIGDLVSFFDRVGGDRLERLDRVPFAAVHRIAEAAHDFHEALKGHRFLLI